MNLLDGKKLSRIIQQEIAEKVSVLKTSGKKIPHLTAILVGNDGASETYVSAKARACEKTGIGTTTIRLPASIKEEELLHEIEKLNHDTAVSGIIVQQPLPQHISTSKIIRAVAPVKDVDGFHPVNAGLMVKGQPCHLPATPLGILMLLERNKIETVGKTCVVLGRSEIVGTPISLLLSRNAYPGNCTVTLCHSKTKNLGSIAREADILIAAMGKPEFVTQDMVKPGAVVIDVGITRVPNPLTKSGYEIKGDVHFESVAPHCSFITPVPGGVGPMTIAALLSNTLRATEMNFS